MHVQGEWWMGHDNPLQIEKDTLSFKESHGYFQKKKIKNKDLYSWAGISDIGGGVGVAG